MGSVFEYALPIDTLHQSAFERYMDKVCSSTGILKAELTSHSRRYENVILRQILMCVARHEYGLTTVKIGEIFHRNHATIIHASKKIKSILGDDILLKQHPHLQHCLCIADEEFNNEHGHYFNELDKWLIAKK